MNLSSKILLPLAACALMASCANESVQEMPVTQGKVMFQVPDFEEEGETDTRMTVTVTSSGATFKWSDGDTLGVFPGNGYQTAFPISDGTGTSSAEFDGGAWALRASMDYAAYYPFQHPMDAVDKNAVPVRYLGQKQTDNNSTAHLGAYDFLAAPFTTVSSTGSTTFTLAHMGALVRFRLYVPAADAFSRLTLTSDGAPFVTSGTIDLTSSNPTLTPTATSDKMTLDLSGVSSEEADDLITLYVMMAPVDQSSAQISVRLSGGNAGYIGSVTGKNMQAGTIYGYSLELEETELLPDDPAVEEPIDNPVAHEYVDLGLPSGTLWATCNVGANNPEEYGDYFAWGETTPHYSVNGADTIWLAGYSAGYYWSTYKYCNNSSTIMTKYCTKEGYGNFDNKPILESADDAATTNWGSAWRMATYIEWQELVNNTTSTWTTMNGVNGRKFMASNGNFIFLPAAERRYETNFYNLGEYGYYWSASLVGDRPDYARYLTFNSSGCIMNMMNRYCGLSVRAVRSAE